MSDIQDPLQVHIGIDLGTVFTKACFNCLDKNERAIVSWETGILDDNKEIIPSVIFITNNNYLHLTKPVNEPSKRIKYFKMALANLHDVTGVLIDNPILPTIDTENDAYKLYTAYYLAQIFSQIEKRIKEKYKTFLSGKEIKYSISVGIPVQYSDSPKKEIFEEVLQAFWYMYPKINQVEHIHNIDTYYTESLQAPKNPDIETVPELLAETVSLFTDIFTNDGYFAIFDIGGGTLDGALAKFYRSQGHKKIEFITAEVKPLGLEVAVNELSKARGIDAKRNIRYMVSSITKKDFQKLYKQVFNNQEVNKKLDSIEKEIRTQTASVVVSAKYKGFALNDCKNELPIIFCGGGKNSWWYRNVILSTYKEHKHYNCAIPPYKSHEINEEQGVFAGIANIYKHRFLVALGLSIPKENRPDIIGFPNKYPKKEKSEDGNVQLDLDDLQREKYGDDR
jgi:hypothetical protein